jgi:LysM repeat protein
VFVFQYICGERAFVDLTGAVSDRPGDGGAVMAIAQWELEELPWPRRVLRVVEDDEVCRPTPVVTPSQPVAAPSPPVSIPAAGPVRHVVATRPRHSAAVLRRRRAVAVAIVVMGVVAALALPLQALAGTTVTPHGAAGGTVYVVQPGDTVWSIAQRADGTGDPRALAASIVRETGSDVVVPGERIAIP